MHVILLSFPGKGTGQGAEEDFLLRTEIFRRQLPLRVVDRKASAPFAGGRRQSVDCQDVHAVVRGPGGQVLLPEAFTSFARHAGGVGRQENVAAPAAADAGDFRDMGFPAKAEADGQSEGGESVRGDLSGDGQVDVTDVSICIDMVLGKKTPDLTIADLDGNGMVDVSDVSAIIDIVLGK